MPLTHNHLDVQFVRSCFPTFSTPLAAKTAFFENAGGSYVAGPVLEKLMTFYQHNKVQPYGYADILNTAGQQMDAGRQTMADLLGVNIATVTLGPSTTQNINTLALGCSSLLHKDSEVIVTDQDHEANIGAWHRLCERSGATLKVWPVNTNSGELHIDQFLKLLSPSTAIVCMTHSSNIIGTINPVKEVISHCRPQGTKVVVDGVSYAPHQWPDIPELQPDAYCFSTYKTYATHLGVMYLSADFNAHSIHSATTLTSLTHKKHWMVPGPITRQLRHSTDSATTSSIATNIIVENLMFHSMRKPRQFRR